MHQGFLTYALATSLAHLHINLPIWTNRIPAVTLNKVFLKTWATTRQIGSLPMIGGLWIWQLRASTWKGCTFVFKLVICHSPWIPLRTELFFIWWLFLPEPKSDKSTKSSRFDLSKSSPSYPPDPCSILYFLWESPNRSQMKELVRPKWPWYDGNSTSGASLTFTVPFFAGHFPSSRPIGYHNTIFVASRGRWLDELANLGRIFLKQMSSTSITEGSAIVQYTRTTWAGSPQIHIIPVEMEIDMKTAVHGWSDRLWQDLVGSSRWREVGRR